MNPTAGSNVHGASKVPRASKVHGLIVANLDVEQDLARSLPSSWRPRGGPKTLPEKVRRTIAAFATLLRALARPGDRLWLPHGIDRQVMEDVPGIPRPELLCGPLPHPGLDRNLPVLAWGESQRISELRRPAPSQQPDERPPHELQLDELLWDLPKPSPQIVARAHHRQFAFELSHQLGRVLPGAHLVSSFAALEQHLLGLGSRFGEDLGWVVKTPLSAAGRDRVWGAGSQVAAPQQRPLEKLFARWPSLLFEPWMERLDDIGVCAIVHSAGVRSLGIHRQLVDRRGQFLGIELRSDDLPTDVPEDLREQADATVHAVGKALFDLGYRGPFGIDGYRYRCPGGSSTWHLLGEINVRLTFGFVARLLAQRLADRLPQAHRMTLRLTSQQATSEQMTSQQATSQQVAERTESDHRPTIYPLLRPHGPSLASAWLEVVEV